MIARRSATAISVVLVVAGVWAVAGRETVQPRSGANPPAPTASRAPAKGEPVAAGSVGFMGDVGELRVIDGSVDTPDGTRWIEEFGYLRIDADDLVLDGVFVKGGVDFYGSGTLTIRNSIIEGGHGSWQTIMLRDTGNRLELSDSTLRWNHRQEQKPGSGPGSIQITGRHAMTVIRSDISGMPDGIQASGSEITITDNWIHDLVALGTGENSTHNDGIQLYEGSTAVEVARNRIEIGAVEGHSNAAVFIAGSSDGSVTDNYLDGGGYSLRVGGGHWTVTGNRFGPNHLFDNHTAADATFDEWSDNLAADGSEIEP